MPTIEKRRIAADADESAPSLHADEWAEASERLRKRGWLRPGGTAEHLALSEEGSAVRQAIEEATDRLSVVAYEAIGEDGCDLLRGLTRPFSRAVVDASGMGG